MIKLLDIESGIFYDMPQDVKISIEKTNPMILDRGTASLPVQLPSTDKNMRLLGFIHRIDKMRKTAMIRNVMIIRGIYQNTGVLEVISTEIGAHIECVILLSDSVIYNKMKNVSMQKVFEGVKRDDFSSLASIDDKVTAWVNYLDKVMCGDVEDDFNIFTVCTENELLLDGKRTCDYINHCGVSYLGYYSNLEKYDKQGNMYQALSGNRTYENIDVKGVKMTIPKGYGVSPFLKLKFVIKSILNYFGFHLDEDYLIKYPYFNKLCIVNNTYDAIMMGVLHFHQLVPTCLVTDFLDSIRNSFACEFIPIGNTNKVKMIFWNDILNFNNEKIRLENVYTHAINFEKPKDLKLSCQRSLRPDNISYDSFQDVLKKGLYQKNVPYPGSQNVRMPSGVYFNRIFLTYFLITDNDYYFYNESLITSKIASGFTDNILVYFDDNSDFEDEEKSSKRESIPLIYIHDVSALRQPFSTENDGCKCLVPFIGSSRKLNTEIVLTVGNNSSVNKSEKGCPILFCFSHGRFRRPKAFYQPRGGYFFSSTHCYHSNGELESTDGFNLEFGGDRGLYETFWKDYDIKMAKNNFHSLIVKLNLSAYDILNFDMLKIYLIDNQPTLCESLKYEITNDLIRVVEATFRTIKTYE